MSIIQFIAYFDLKQKSVSQTRDGFIDDASKTIKDEVDRIFFKKM